jgi:hypothetical protein
MSSSRTRLVSRLALESFVIVGSILAAFALDTWWDNRQEREEEQETLAALRAEFLSAQVDIRWYKETEDRILGSVTLIVDSLAVAHEAGRRSVTFPDTALGLAYVPPTVSPSLGTLEGIISSGRLGLLRDPELRAALAAWEGHMDELAEEELSSKAIVEGDMDRVFRLRFSTVGLWQTAAALLAEERAGQGDFSAGRRVPVDTEILGVMETRRSLLVHTMTEYDTLEEELENILALIERSLDD